MYDFLKSKDLNMENITVKYKYSICRLKKHDLFGGFFFTITLIWAVPEFHMNLYLNVYVQIDEFTKGLSIIQNFKIPYVFFSKSGCGFFCIM